MASILPEHARGKSLEIWFQDEARVGQQGTLTRIWAKRGSRPRAPRDLRHEWAYIFGAVCPARGATAALVLPHANTEAFSLHLAEISKEVASGVHAILTLDGIVVPFVSRVKRRMCIRIYAAQRPAPKAATINLAS